MYDVPAARTATDRWWRGLARHLRGAGVAAVPESLSREPVPAWTDPALLFSQTCGYPLTHALAGRVQLLGTPVYRAPGCHGWRYASALVVSAESTARGLVDLRGGVCAFNAPDSHSGYNVLRRMVAPLAGGDTFFGGLLETGAHRASIAAVGEGRADLCAVDCVTHALLVRHDPVALHGTRVLDFSPAAPGLPYIAGPSVAGETCRRMCRALDAAVADPGLADVRAALLIEGVETVPTAAYEDIVTMEREAAELGYPVLA